MKVAQVNEPGHSSVFVEMTCRMVASLRMIRSLGDNIMTPRVPKAAFGNSDETHGETS